MRDYGEEPAQLAALAERLERFSTVVSFNGKAFDLPLIETRLALSRIPFGLAGAPHLDLLFPSRRIWKNSLPSCALSSLETEVLGVRRTGEDVPGYLIPALYFDYVRGGDAGPMAGVFYHNVQDILSLVTLSVRIFLTSSRIHWTPACVAHWKSWVWRASTKTPAASTRARKCIKRR